MRTDVRPEYRDTIFEVCPSWLEMDDARREGTVVHELSHILAGPLVNFTRDIIRNLSEEDTPLRSLLDKQCENAFEGVVEDTGRAFVRMRDA